MLNVIQLIKHLIRNVSIFSVMLAPDMFIRLNMV